MTDTPAFTSFAPGFEFLQGLVKNAGAALPAMGQWVAPTLSPEELDKRIQELRHHDEVSIAWQRKILRETLMKVALFEVREIFTEIDEDGNTNDGLRLKHYITYVKLLEEHVKSLGISTLPPPLETLTERGMLRKEYTGDPVHGNIEYGRRVLAQIQRFLRATT
jgi:hypothetical protein